MVTLLTLLRKIELEMLPHLKIFSATVGDDPDAAALDLGEVRRHGLQEVGGEAQLRPLVLDGGQQRHRDLGQVVARGGYEHLILVFMGF